jgi:hypothetical protein
MYPGWLGVRKVARRVTVAVRVPEVSRGLAQGTELTLGLGSLKAVQLGRPGRQGYPAGRSFGLELAAGEQMQAVAAAVQSDCCGWFGAAS